MVPFQAQHILTYLYTFILKNRYDICNQLHSAKGLRGHLILIFINIYIGINVILVIYTNVMKKLV